MSSGRTVESTRTLVSQRADGGRFVGRHSVETHELAPLRDSRTRHAQKRSYTTARERVSDSVGTSSPPSDLVRRIHPPYQQRQDGRPPRSNVSDEDLKAGFGYSVSSTPVSSNRAPPLVLSATAICQPCAVAICLTMFNPNPVPCAAVEYPASKISSLSLSPIPTPSSST